MIAKIKILQDGRVKILKPNLKNKSKQFVKDFCNYVTYIIESEGKMNGDEFSFDYPIKVIKTPQKMVDKLNKFNNVFQKVK